MDILKQSFPINKLSDTVLGRLQAKLKEVTFNKGHVLFKEGELDSTLYVIVSGTLELYRRRTYVPVADNASGEASIVGSEKIKTVNAGDVVGLRHLLSEKVRFSTLIVASDTAKLLMLNRDGFYEALEGDGHSLRVLCEVLASELLIANRNYTPALNEPKQGEQSAHVTMTIFDTKDYDKTHFKALEDEYKKLGVTLNFQESRLTEKTAPLARGSQIICVFVNDDANAATLAILQSLGVKMIALRCAGFNNVDIKACNSMEISVSRVPSYSPYAVAEHAAALMLSLNRKIPRSAAKTKNGDFTLNSGLLGFDLHGKVGGVVGTGKIGKIFANILLGFGMQVVCYDVYQDAELKATKNVRYVDNLEDLYAAADVISLHSPLTTQTFHMINDKAIAAMKPGVLLINTGRGGLIDTNALVAGLKTGKVGAAGLDVYEDEREYFFENWSDRSIKDDKLSRLLTFNNVILTPHQAFFTQEALTAIAQTTLDNVREFIGGKRLLEMKNTVNNC